MTIRLRNYEWTLISLLTGITIVSYLWEYYYLSTSDISQKFTQPFNEHNLSFNYFTNVLSPKIGAVLIIYLLYLAVHLLKIPQLLVTRQKTGIQYFWIIVLLILLTFLLALGINAASYFAQPAFFSYGGYKVMALLGYNETPLTDLFFGFKRAFFMVGLYLVYACARELLIKRIQKSTRSNYLSLITNQIALIFVIYLTVPFFAGTFELIEDDFFYQLYVLLLTPTVLVYLTNTYWIFPSSDTKPWLSIRVSALVILTTLFYSFFFYWLSHHSFLLLLWLSTWGVQFFIVTPITWLLFEQRKDKLLQLRGTEKALVKSKADLQLLRSQINPHFLFNTLNSLYGMALMDGSLRTAEGIQKLGEMMRFMLHDNHQDFIPMSLEINYLKNYLSLQKLRIQPSSRLSIEEDINEQHCTHTIAPMLLIPFVENAFKHGIHINEPSWIKIRLRCDKNTLRLEVKNSIHTAQNNDPEKEHSGIGLENVKERLHLFYEHKYQLTYGTDGTEFKVDLFIKLTD